MASSEEPLLPDGKAARESEVLKQKQDAKHRDKQDKDAKKFEEDGNTLDDRKTWLTTVPSWFGRFWIEVPDSNVIDIVKKRTEESLEIWSSDNKVSKTGSDVEDHSVGPALALTFRANTIIWIFFTVLPWIVSVQWPWVDTSTDGAAGSIISCDTSGSQVLPFAIYPKSLWVIFFIVTGVLIHFEMRAFASSSVAQVVVAGIPKLAGKKLSYGRFLLVMLIISLIYHFDIFTNGIFVGRVLVTSRCVEFHSSEGNHHTPDTIWEQTIKKSVLSGLSGFSFFTWCVAAWASLYLQPLYSYAYALPVSPQLQDPLPERKRVEPNDLPDVDYDTKAADKDCPVYMVAFRADQQHGRALQAMSESARMNSLYFLDPDYIGYQTNSWRPTDVHREMQRTNVRFFIFIVETMLPPNLQATFLCFEKAMAYHTAQEGLQGDYVILISVIFSFITGLIYVRSELTAVMHFHELIKRQKWKFDNYAKDAEELKREEIFKARSAMKKAARSAFICKILASVGMFFLTYAVMKAIMGTFYCEVGMWNLKFDMTKGFAKGCLTPEELFHGA